jgi:hypothetical protein
MGGIDQSDEDTAIYSANDAKEDRSEDGRGEAEVVEKNDAGLEEGERCVGPEKAEVRDEGEIRRAVRIEVRRRSPLLVAVLRQRLKAAESREKRARGESVVDDREYGLALT